MGNSKQRRAPQNTLGTHSHGIHSLWPWNHIGVYIGPHFGQGGEISSTGPYPAALLKQLFLGLVSSFLLVIISSCCWLQGKKMFILFISHARYNLLSFLIFSRLYARELYIYFNFILHKTFINLWDRYSSSLEFYRWTHWGWEQFRCLMGHGVSDRPEIWATSSDSNSCSLLVHYVKPFS